MRNALPFNVTDGPDLHVRVRRQRWRYRAGAIGVIGAAALVAAGCGSSSPASTASASPTAAAPAATSATKAIKITATLTEFKIKLSQTKLKPGLYTFDAVNAGHTVHALEIDGPGVEDKATKGQLKPGQSALLTVTLKAGKYDMYCPVGDHKELGMNLELTVGGAAPGATAPAATATTVASGGGSGY
jgi:uncharacterized cupredoxin-like copper-binding protein